MANLALAFDILARDKNATRTFNTVGRSAESAGKKGKAFGSLMSGAAKVAGGALAAAGIAQLMGNITNALGESIAEAREAQKVGRTTGAIIKATGGAAKVSQKQVEDLAGALSEKAGVDDEVIQSGANLLLTFKNVRNEAGKGAKIFDRATKSAVDLSAAGFGSVEGASKMLGKALNDPVKGLSALGRAGVTFTDQQKATIKALVDGGSKYAAVSMGLVRNADEWKAGLKAVKGNVGDLEASLTKKLSPAQKKQFKYLSDGNHALEAQKIILGEVESQVGGVAEANASMGDKVKVAWGNIKEELGTALLPILDRLGKWFLQKGIPGIRQFGGAVSGLFQLLVKGDFTGSLQKAFGWAEDSRPVDNLFRLRDGFIAVTDYVRTSVIPTVQSFGGWLSGSLWPAIKQGYQTIMPALKQAFDIVAGAFKGSGAEGASFRENLRKFGVVITTVVIPLLSNMARVWLPLVATNLRILIEAVKLAWGAFTTFKNVIDTVISFVLRRFADALQGFSALLSALGKIPKFGWAKDAAASMQTAADKARGLATAIDNIDKNVVINVGFKPVQGRIQVAGQSVNVGMRHSGGPVNPGSIYQVGDNPDGSWNSTTEILAPRRPMRVLNQEQMAKQLGTGGVGAVGGRTDLSEASIQRLVSAIQSVTLRPTISAGSVDAAVGGTLR